MKYKNTLQKGSVRYLVFQEGTRWYGVALEFNIVEAGDNPTKVLNSLFEAIRGYLNSAKKIKARPHILNQKTDAEYEQLWEKIQEAKNNRGILVRQPFSIFTSGQANLAFV